MNYEALLEWATPRQAEYVAALVKYGSERKAAKAFGISKGSISAALANLRRRAALQGCAPEHDMVHPVPAPFVVRGTSTLYDEAGVAKLQWVKTRLDEQQVEETIKAAVKALTEEARGCVEPTPAHPASDSKLCNLFTLTDCHIGMLAWAKETGADWDLKIAESTLVQAFRHLICAAPQADTAVVLELGDFLHIDSLLAITPTSGNLLDADGRYSKMVGVAIRVLRTVIDLALAKHRAVHVVAAEGNHDPGSSIWLRHLLTIAYEREPRLTVDDSELPFYAFQHGNVFLGFHHGHLVKPDRLPELFAARHRKMWGGTTKVYIHTGHKHSVAETEYPGAKVIQHPTLAAPDAYAARNGWVSEREITAITYHSEFGQVARNTVTPEMLE